MFGYNIYIYMDFQVIIRYILHDVGPCSSPSGIVSWSLLVGFSDQSSLSIGRETTAYSIYSQTTVVSADVSLEVPHVVKEFAFSQRFSR